MGWIRATRRMSADAAQATIGSTPSETGPVLNGTAPAKSVLPLGPKHPLAQGMQNNSPPQTSSAPMAAPTGPHAPQPAPDLAATPSTAVLVSPVDLVEGLFVTIQAVCAPPASC